MTEINQRQDVKVAVRETVQRGSDVHQKIKAITLKALAERQLDRENIKTVVEAVSKGINEGLTAQSIQAKVLFSQAALALDDALAIAAEASKLAIEEAGSKVSDYSQYDLDSASKDILDMEGIFLDALENIVKGNQVVADVVGDFVTHARQSGTAVGKQALTALDALKQLPNWGKDIVVSNTVSASITLAQIGSGILLGIAESLQSSPSKK
jgi:hypothetical protein